MHFCFVALEGVTLFDDVSYLLILQREKCGQGVGTSKKKTIGDINAEETSSDSSDDEEDSPTTLNYKTPLLTQVNLLHSVHLLLSFETNDSRECSFNILANNSFPNLSFCDMACPSIWVKRFIRI